MDKQYERQREYEDVIDLFFPFIITRPEHVNFLKSDMKTFQLIVNSLFNDFNVIHVG